MGEKEVAMQAMATACDWRCHKEANESVGMASQGQERPYTQARNVLESQETAYAGVALEQYQVMVYECIESEYIGRETDYVLAADCT